ncbi:MAG: aminoacyl--tRNA ligase-related protein [Candidatus Hadarchaeales archaeon]
MKFTLRARLRFSGGLEECREEIGRLLESSSELLRKGAPPGKEGARVEGWEVKGEELELLLVSDRYVRAHSALLRLARVLREMLGRHRLGLREIKGLEYRLELPSLPGGVDDLLRGLHYEVEREEGRVSLVLRGLSESDLRRGTVDRLVSLVEQQPVIPTAGQVPEAVREEEGTPPIFSGNPTEEMEKRGWIQEFPGRGQWLYGPPFVSLLRALEELILEEVVRPLGFREAMFPKLISLEVMKNMPGYLDGIPEGMYYVCSPPRDPQAFSRFKAEMKLRKRVASELLKEAVENPSYVLAPAQCEPFYQMFSGRQVRLEELPVKLFDRSGWTYRWEGGGAEGLIRTHEFRRIELVFLGSPEQVVELREGVRERSENLLRKLGVRWRLTVATPFYLREGEKEKSGPEVATYDLEVRLPYKQDWLEVASLNVHGDKFVKSFGIKEARGRRIWTGCCGFGTTRWAVGFLAHYGLEEGSWPGPVRAHVRVLSTGEKGGG